MFRMFKGLVGVTAVVGAGYMAKPVLEDRYRTAKPSAALSNQSDAAKADMQKDGFTTVSVQHFEGEKVGAFYADGRQDPGVIGKMTGGVPSTRHVSQATFFDKVQVTHVSDDAQSALSVRFKRS